LIVQHKAKDSSIEHSSNLVRTIFVPCSYHVRSLFECCSIVVRSLFECCSIRIRKLQGRYLYRQRKCKKPYARHNVSLRRIISKAPALQQEQTKQNGMNVNIK